MTEPQSSAPPNKLLGLELLRFVAALAVVVWHYCEFSYVADSPVNLFKNRLPFYGLLQPLYETGEYAVWVFWCISGFIFFWKYRDAIADRSIGGARFFVFRLSRLYPLHLVTLALVAILQPVYFHLNGFYFVYQANDVRHFLLQLFMASNWGFQHGNSLNGPIWSISVEVLVYLVFFLMLRFVTRSALLNLVMIAVGIVATGQIACCLAFFYIGGLAAMARRAMARTRHRGAIEGTAWLLAVALPLFCRGELSDLMILAYTPVVLFCLSGNLGVTPRVQRIIEAAGNMTYSSYLVHFPLQLLIAVGFAMSSTPIPFYDPAFFVAFVAATLMASRLIYRHFEAPAQALLRSRLLLPQGVVTTRALAATSQPWPRKAD
jgi:peptidoglycan/LPS O-acetylase OafA/YrhL